MDFTNGEEGRNFIAPFRFSRAISAVLFSIFLLAAHLHGDLGGSSTEVDLNEVSKTRYVQTGTWGGNGVRMQIGRSSASIEYPCADGMIVGRIRVDAKGNFKASGTHTVIRPGPVKEGASPPSRAARYEGRVQGENMTLTVTLTDSNEIIGKFELRKGSVVRLHRCL